MMMNSFVSADVKAIYRSSKWLATAATALFAVAAAWLISTPAAAQGCTTVEGQGTTYCPPPPQSGSPSGQGSFPSSGRWETRWGAIALGTTSENKGVYGTADGFSSKGKAQKAAMADCRKWNGQNCKVAVAYYNQCGVIASGDTRSATARGPTPEVAMRLALKDCNDITRNCVLWHAGCSYAERVG